MTNTFSKKLAALAATGLISAACGGGDKHAESPAEAAEGAPSDAESAGAEAAGAEGEKDQCKGKNDCKGQGACKVEGKHECAGQNECKGQGGCKAKAPQ